jgi:uncharacterized membrane protein
MKSKSTISVLPNNAFFRILGIPALLLTILFTAMQFSSEMKWDETDFLMLGLLLVGAISLVELAMKTKGKYRVYAIAAVILGALWLYVELAVGLFTTWGS